jgi:hypothetical protein
MNRSYPALSKPSNFLMKAGFAQRTEEGGGGRGKALKATKLRGQARSQTPAESGKFGNEEKNEIRD